MRGKTFDNYHWLSGDIIRIGAIVGVVVIHVTDYLLYSGIYSHGATWWAANFLRSVSRVSVPLFIMLSGFLLLDESKRYSQKELIYKTVFRLGVPLLFWYGVNVCWQCFYWRTKFDAGSVIDHFLRADIFHLYYLQVLMGLYLMVPVIVRIDKKLSYASKVWVTAGMFGLAYGGMSLIDMFQLKGWVNMLTIFSLYLGYFYAGHLGRLTYLPKKVVWGLGGILLFLVAITGIGKIPYLDNGRYLANYTSPGVVIMSLCIFTVIVSLEDGWRWWISRSGKKVLSFLAANVFGVYLVHAIVKDIVEGKILMIHTVESRLWLYLIENMVLVLTISCVITVIGRRIRGVRWVFGE